MSELIFATYLKELKDAWTEDIADPDLINLLYDAVSEPMGLVNKENGTITTEKSAASKMMNRQKGGNALKVIRNNANKDKVRSTIEQHFSDQRGYYFAAEAVRRGTCDIYSDESQFDVLKKETYEGVKEVWEEEYKNGYTRLRKVVSQASVTRVDKCWLSGDTDWVENPQKKGVCHFLVKEGKLDGWVRDDDEQTI